MNIVTHIWRFSLGAPLLQTETLNASHHTGGCYANTRTKKQSQEKGGSFTWFRSLPLTSNRAANDHPSGFATTTTTTLHLDVIKR